MLRGVAHADHGRNRKLARPSAQRRGRRKANGPK
jgi:hypothetical protein